MTDAIQSDNLWARLSFFLAPVTTTVTPALRLELVTNATGRVRANVHGLDTLTANNLKVSGLFTPTGATPVALRLDRASLAQTALAFESVMPMRGTFEVTVTTGRRTFTLRAEYMPGR